MDVMSAMMKLKSNIPTPLKDHFTKQKIGNKFIFILEGTLSAGFARVKNIERKVTRDKYLEGGSNLKPIILAAQQAELSSLVLEQGFVFMPNALTAALMKEVKNEKHNFKTGILAVLNKYYIPIRIFYFEKGIVSEWRMSDLDAEKPGIVLDSMTITHSGLVELSLADLI